MRCDMIKRVTHVSEQASPMSPVYTTTGTFFFTSALDINARHARKCVEQFVVEFELGQEELVEAQA